MKYLAAVLVAFAAVASPMLAQDEASIDEGKRLAQENCAQCHDIEPGGAFKQYPPSFAAIATYYDPNTIEVKIMFPSHAVLMPEFHTFLFVDNIEKLVGYIVSLED